MKRRHSLLLSVLLCGCAETDPSQQRTDAVEHQQSARDFEQQIEALRNTPAIKAVSDIESEIERLDAELDAKRDEGYARTEKLRDSPEYAAAEEKIIALEALRGKAWERERKAMIDAARSLYGARHAELRAMTSGPLTQARSLGFDLVSYPRLDGSTSTQPLMLVIAARLLGVTYEWIYPEPRGFPWSRSIVPRNAFSIPTSGSLEKMWQRPLFERDEELDIAASKVIAKANDQPGQDRIAMMINSVLAAPTNTHDAYVNLIEGKTDLVINVRGPSASERALAERKGIRLQTTSVAKDALVFIVNVKNPVKTLSSRQIRAIYTDDVTRWDKLGVRLERARDEANSGREQVTAYVRDRLSGSRELFDELVMKGASEVKPQKRPELISSSMSGPFNQVTQDETGIGYSVYYYEHFMAASPYTRTVGVDGVEPSAESIAAGKYPYVTPIYAVCRAGELPDSPASRLLNWLLSDEGQAVVRESGYVPVK